MCVEEKKLGKKKGKKKGNMDEKNKEMREK